MSEGPISYHKVLLHLNITFLDQQQIWRNLPLGLDPYSPSVSVTGEDDGLGMFEMPSEISSLLAERHNVSITISKGLPRSLAAVPSTDLLGHSIEMVVKHRDRE